MIQEPPKDEVIDHEAMLNRVVKIIDPVRTVYELRMVHRQLQMLEALGLLDKSILKRFEDIMFIVRGNLVDERSITPGHILYDEVRDRPADIGFDLGDTVRWQGKERTHEGELIFLGRAFTRHEICPKSEDGWISGKARASFLKTCLAARARIKTEIRQLCLTGCVVRVVTTVTKGKKKSKRYIYYCPNSSDLKKVEKT